MLSVVLGIQNAVAMQQNISRQINTMPMIHQTIALTEPCEAGADVSIDV